MRLPGAAGSNEQEAASFRPSWPFVDEGLHLVFGRDQRAIVAVIERFQPAVVIPAGDVGRGDPMPPPQIALASARLHAEGVAVKGHPTGAATAGTGRRRFRGGRLHGWGESSRGVTNAEC